MPWLAPPIPLLWPEAGDRDVSGEPRGCGAEQPRWVQPVGDVQSLLPLWVWVTRSPSGRTIAQVQEIRIRDPPQPPARGSAQAGSRAPPSFGLGAETCRSLRLAAGDRFFLARFSLAQRRPEMFADPGGCLRSIGAALPTAREVWLPQSSPFSGL